MRHLAGVIGGLIALTICLPVYAQLVVPGPPMPQESAPPSPTDGLLPNGGFCFGWILYESPYDDVYFNVEAVAFRRDWETTQPIATLNNATNNVLTTGDLQFISQPGIRVLLGARLNDWWAIESTFLGLFVWDEAAAVQNETLNSFGTVGNLFSPFTNFGKPPEAGFDYNSQIAISGRSTFNSGEFNVRQRFDTPPSLMQASGLYGFRYINIQERFAYRASSNVPLLGGTGTAVDVETENNLYGFQVGGTLEFRLEPRGWINFEGKFLMMRNGASQDIDYATGPLAGPDTTVASSRSSSRVAFGADVSGSVIWKFTPRLVGHVGYQGVFLDGLALAAQNFVQNAEFIPSGTTDVYQKGRLAFHGPFMGLTYTW